MKKNRAIILLGFFAVGMVSLFLAAVGTSAQMSVEESFKTANKLYREGKFKEAMESYQQIIAQGNVSSSIYYNLGNAYVKTGETGKAILSYERALQENPRDPEVRANLEYVRGLLFDRTEDSSLGTLFEKFSPTQWFSWRENLWSFVVFYWAGALIGLIAILTRRKFAKENSVESGGKNPKEILVVTASVLLGASLLLGAMLFLRSPLWTHPRAVIVAKEVEVRYGPVLGESTAFTLHEGSKVKVLRSTGDWVQILFAKGKVGWVMLESLEKI